MLLKVTILHVHDFTRIHPIMIVTQCQKATMEIERERTLSQDCPRRNIGTFKLCNKHDVANLLSKPLLFDVCDVILMLRSHTACVGH